MVNKTIYGTFNSTGLDHAFARWNRFRRRGRRGDNVCVEATARDAADLGYQVVLLDDGCAALFERRGVRTLRKRTEFPLQAGWLARMSKPSAAKGAGACLFRMFSTPG